MKTDAMNGLMVAAAVLMTAGSSLLGPTTAIPPTIRRGFRFVHSVTMPMVFRLGLNSSLTPPQMTINATPASLGFAVVATVRLIVEAVGALTGVVGLSLDGLAEKVKAIEIGFLTIAQESGRSLANGFDGVGETSKTLNDLAAKLDRAVA